MKRIKIAQIGMNRNSHAPDIFNTLKKLPEIFEIVGYVLPENEKERLSDRLEAFEGYKELKLDEVLNDPEIEAVTIETDEIYTTKYATLAAKAGKHIHMEKPGGTSLEDFEQLIAQVKKGGKVFHTGYMYRYNPYVLELLEKVKSGELGEIINVEAQMNCIHTKENRQWLEDFPGGMMFFLGCHLVDLILLIQGKPERIIPYNKCTGVEGVTSEDFGMAVFEYKNGISFAKTNATEIGGFARRQLIVVGTRGTFEIKPLEMYEGNAQMYTKKTEYGSLDWNNMGDTVKSDYIDRYENMMSSFACYIRGEKENPYTYDYELELYKILLKACGAE